MASGPVDVNVHQAGCNVTSAHVDFVYSRVVTGQGIDVKDLDVDFYLYSPYKVFGPHMGVLYGKREILSLLANQGHYFQAENDFQRRLCPGGTNYELSAAAAGIGDYLDLVHERHYPGANVDRRERIDQTFALFSAHEAEMAERIAAFLAEQKGLRLAGRGAPPDRSRVGVFSFTVEGRDSREIPAALRDRKIGIHADDFYAARCIDALGARAQNGVVRVSLVHYNTADDVGRLFTGLEEAL